VLKFEDDKFVEMFIRLYIDRCEQVHALAFYQFRYTQECLTASDREEVEEIFQTRLSMLLEIL